MPDAAANDHIVIGAATLCGAARRVEDRRARPRHPLHDHLPQRFAGDIDPIAQGIGAEQRGVWIGAEDVDEGTGVERIDMLGIEREARTREAVGDTGMDDAQPPDRAEQPQRAAARRLDQPAVRPRERGQVAARDVGDDQHLGLSGIVERAGHR